MFAEVINMKKNFDYLYEIFEDHLYENILESESEDLFVCRVVDRYMLEIRKNSVMPLHFLEDIKEDTADMVYDMLLKKIYGFYSLDHYRHNLKNIKIY